MDVELLRAVPFLKELTEDQLHSVAALATEARVPAGGVIFEENAPGDTFFVVLSGRVRIVKNLAAGGQEALAFVEPGSYFGEMALIDDFPRSATAVAHEDCRLSAIKKDALKDLLFVDRDLAVTLLWGFVRTLSLRLRETNEKLKAFFAFSGGF